MKKIILSLAMISTIFAFAQKREINTAFKTAESGDYNTAKTQVAVAENAVSANPGKVDADLLEKLYYAKGLSLLKTGEISEGAEALAKINDLKSAKFTPNLTPKVIEVISPLLQTTQKSAMDAYNAKNYSEAGPKFRQVYDLLKAAGQDNKQFLYYSAITYALANDRANAINTYNELINSGYTGVETKYLAKNKKTNTVEELDKSSFELMKKAGASSEYTDFKTETTKSIEQELYETNAGLLLDEGRYDEAIALSKRGIEKFPTNAKFPEIQGMAYYKSNRTDEFIASLKDLVSKNPQDKIAWFNLGVLASKDPAKKSDAEGYFKKVIEIDPNYGSAYQNLAYMIMDLENDGKYVEEYNALRKAQKSTEANKLMDARRERFAKALPYVEKWYSIDPNNADTISLLKGMYLTTRNDAKYQEFKAKEAALQKK